MVLMVWMAELKVDHYPLVAIRHHTVGAMLLHFAIFYRENGTLVKECPAG